MFFSNKRLIYAHQDRNRPYYNHSYDRDVRDALCSECGKVIGEQVRYPHFKESFHFEDEKAKYTHCPYCGHKFNFKEKN